MRQANGEDRREQTEESNGDSAIDANRLGAAYEGEVKEAERARAR